VVPVTLMQAGRHESVDTLRAAVDPWWEGGIDENVYRDDGLWRMEKPRCQAIWHGDFK
jgi:hypothetical protein